MKRIPDLIEVIQKLAEESSKQSHVIRIVSCGYMENPAYKKQKKHMHFQLQFRTIRLKNNSDPGLFRILVKNGEK